MGSIKTEAQFSLLVTVMLLLVDMIGSKYEERNKSYKGEACLLFVNMRDERSYRWPLAPEDQIPRYCLQVLPIAPLPSIYQRAITKGKNERRCAASVS